jgi:apolipoprotein N-acyltransferase
LKRHPQLKNYLLAVLSALLLVLAFPRFSLAFLAAFALAPLLVAVAGEPSPKRRFMLGWVAGVVYWFGVCYWIQFVLAYHGGMGEAAGWAAFMLFCGLKAIHMGVFAVAAGVLMRAWYAIPAVAALWVGIEWTHNYLGFAWLALGNAAIGMSVPLRLAPYTGVYGISFAFMMMAAAVAVAALRRPRLHLAWLTALLFVGLLPRVPPPERAREAAALVQPNIAMDTEWTHQSVNEMHVDLLELSMEVVRNAPDDQKPTVIVWPEVPAPLYYENEARFRDFVNLLARSTGAYLLLGVVAYQPDGAPLNSAALVSPQGELVTRYDKMNLVPFGEYVPWPLGRLVEKISTEAGDFAPGRQLVVSPFRDRRLGTFICYESVFPHFVRRFANDGAEVLFNISNDGYFGRSAAREQHLDIARMRAVENRRWLLRATNDGRTATIDPGGHIRAELPPYVGAAQRTGYTFISERTFYTRVGDWFPIFCGVASLGLLGFAVRQTAASRRLP